MVGVAISVFGFNTYCMGIAGYFLVELLCIQLVVWVTVHFDSSELYKLLNLANKYYNSSVGMKFKYLPVFTKFSKKGGVIYT